MDDSKTDWFWPIFVVGLVASLGLVSKFTQRGETVTPAKK